MATQILDKQTLDKDTLEKSNTDEQKTENIQPVSFGILPMSKSEPKTDIRDLSILIYGDPGIGKSTWCANAENALFLATEEGLNNLSVYKISIPDWQTFVKSVNEITTGNHQFKTIIIDTIDNLYKLCAAYFNAIHNIEHEGDLDYGKGFHLIYRQLDLWLTHLSHLPYGLIMTSHATCKDVKTPTGTTKKITLTLPEKVKDIVWGMTDLFLYVDQVEIRNEQGMITGYNRVVRSQPTTIYEAKDRTGKLPDDLPLDYSLFAKAISQKS